MATAATANDPRPWHAQPGRLALSADGKRIAWLVPDGVELVEVATGKAILVELAGATSAVAFSDQVWVVAGFPPALHRLGAGGQPLGAPAPLPAGGALIAAATGTPAAVWHSAPPVELHDDLGALAVRTL